MVTVVSSNPTGGHFTFFYFLKSSVSILYRNVRVVLKTKNPIALLVTGATETTELLGQITKTTASEGTWDPTI